MFKHILVATDGSSLSGDAVRTAADLAAKTGARLTALTVRPPFLPSFPDWSGSYGAIQVQADFDDATNADADRRLTEARRIAADCGVGCDGDAVISPAPWRAILDAARERGCDFIVMASHGRKGMDAVLLGSETHKVLTHSSIPVLVTR